MPISDQDQLLIQKYLQGRLTDSEQALLEKRLTDPAFKIEFQFYQGIKKSSIDIHRDQLKSTFQEWDNAPSAKVIQSKPNYLNWKIAAGFLLLISFGSLWFFLQQESPEQLFTKYYTPYANLIDPINKGDAPVEASLTQLYELGRYEDVVKIEDDDDYLSFYRSLARIETKEVETAIVELQQYATNNGFRFQEAAQWYLALCYLQNGEVEKCKGILDDIQMVDGHDFQQVALKLYMQLD